MDIKTHHRQWPSIRIVRVHWLKSKSMMQSWELFWHWIISNGWYILLCIHMVFSLNPSKAYYLRIMDIKMHDHRWPTIWLVRVHSLKCKLAMQSWAICWHWIISSGWYILLCIHMVFSLNPSKAYYLQIMDIKMHDHWWPTIRLVRFHSLKSKLMMHPWSICWHWIISNGWYILLCIHMVFALNPSKAYYL